MSSESPFYYSQIECPICKTVNEFETIKPGSFREGDRDTDFCPRDIEWTIEKYSNYNPLIYFVAVCSNCFYARELNAQFKEWNKDNDFMNKCLKETKANHLDKLAEANSIIKKISSMIDVSRYPNETGIIKLHLAVYDELLSNRFSNLNLGRFYLRLGWMFRANTANKNNPIPIINDGFEVEEQFRQLFQSLNNSYHQINDLQRLIESRLGEADTAAAIVNQWTAIKGLFDSKFEVILKKLNEVKADSNEFDFESSEYKTILSGNYSTDNNQNTYESYKSFEQFLTELKSEWDGVVINEDEALMKAIYYYSQAFNAPDELHQGNQKLQAAYLIAELSRRVGQFEQARKYFNQTIAYGQEFVNQNRDDKAAIALAKKIMELAIEQGKENKIVQPV